MELLERNLSKTGGFALQHLFFSLLVGDKECEEVILALLGNFFSSYRPPEPTHVSSSPVRFCLPEPIMQACKSSSDDKEKEHNNYRLRIQVM